MGDAAGTRMMMATVRGTAKIIAYISAVAGVLSLHDHEHELATSTYLSYVNFPEQTENHS